MRLLRVSLFLNGFWSHRFPPKNERMDSFFTNMRIVFVRFLEEIDDPKKPFRN